MRGLSGPGNPIHAGARGGVTQLSMPSTRPARTRLRRDATNARMRLSGPVSNDPGTNASEASKDSRATTVGDWNGLLPKENPVTRRHRIQQGLWRAEHLHWPAGEPQKDRRVRDRYPTLPNWLAETHNGVSVVDEGPNLMSREGRSYTRDRLRVLETIDGKAETDRLWRNLLSSQPMAFSIAGHSRSLSRGRGPAFRPDRDASSAPDSARSRHRKRGCLRTRRDRCRVVSSAF